MFRHENRNVPPHKFQYPKHYTFPKTIFTATNVVVFTHDFDKPHLLPSDLEETFCFFEGALAPEKEQLMLLAKNVEAYECQNSEELANTIRQFANKKSMFVFLFTRTVFWETFSP